jgi:RNA polymerase sigma-70 factor (ECF subfamily)
MMGPVYTVGTARSQSVQRTAEVIYHELLVLRFRRGDKSAFEELVRAWEKRLFYFIRRLVDDEQDAWDILQQTWIRVLSGIGAVREPASLGPWLYRVARNAAFNHGQVNATYHRFLKNYQAAAPPSADEASAPVDFETAEALHRGLVRLPVPHREVLTLFFLEDFSIDQIAHILDVPAGTVKSRLHHAKKALRDLLGKED